MLASVCTVFLYDTYDICSGGCKMYLFHRRLSIPVHLSPVLRRMRGHRNQSATTLIYAKHISLKPAIIFFFASTFFFASPTRIPF